MKNIRSIGIVLLFAIVSCKDPIKKKSASAVESSRQIDKIRLKDLSGQIIDLQNYKGKTIFVNFWATWCRPCLEEMPSIEKLQDIMRNEDVVFLLASSESLQEIDEFRKDHSFKFKYASIENSEELGIQALPTTFIFSPQGDLVFSEQGARKWEEKSNVDTILKIANKND